MNHSEIMHIIAEAERWVDRVEPYREERMSETKNAWRLGFAAAMQRIEMIVLDAESK